MPPLVPPLPPPRPTLRLCEIFRSIQGESTYMGLPCVFIRTAGCDVGCRWCDTRYALTEPGRALTIPMIVEAVRAYATPLVEITGGEPLLQTETPALAHALVAEGFTVLVETSGTRDIRVLPPPIIRVMDVKCPASGVADRMYWDNLSALRPADEVKFVLADRADYEYARDLVRRHDLTTRCAVLYSPVAGALPPADLADWLLSDGDQVRLQWPLHRQLWPAEPRGR